MRFNRLSVCKGSMGFYAVFLLPGLRGRISLTTLYACSLSLVGKIVACSYTGMHNSKAAYCALTAV